MIRELLILMSSRKAIRIKKIKMILEFEIEPIYERISTNAPATVDEALKIKLLKHLSEEGGERGYVNDKSAPEIQQLKIFTCRDIPLLDPLGYITLEVHRVEKYWNATANLIGNPKFVNSKFRKY